MNDIAAQERYTKVLALLVVAAAAQLPFADAAFAQAMDNSVFTPVQTVLQEIVNFITGPFGRLAATIAVIGLGFLAFAGRLSWFMAGAVIIGIGLVFGAQGIVNQLADLAQS